MTKQSKGLSLFIVLIAYIAAFFGGLLFYLILVNTTGSMLLAFFVADVAATVVVWLIGLLFRNASMYDPYWSVVPIVLIICFILAMVPEYTQINIVSILYLIVFAFWGIRLTMNWIIGWPGMQHQDWRYTMLRENNPKLWLITNFFGINMMPTLFVFACMVPAYFGTQMGIGFNAVTVIGAAICILAAITQIISDGQMRRFRKNLDNAGKNMETGLWKYSRHPNYLGEVTFWWGIWLMQLSVLPNYWWTVAAPILMTLLFVGISIPMMEKRLMASKQGYADYVKRTSMLILLPKKS